MEHRTVKSGFMPGVERRPGGERRPRFRTRGAVRRGSGSIQLADDDRGSACYVCGEPQNVRFLQFNSPVRGDRMFLRLCDGCLDVLFLEHRAFNARCAVFGHEWVTDGQGVYRCVRCRDVCACAGCDVVRREPTPATEGGQQRRPGATDPAGRD